MRVICKSNARNPHWICAVFTALPVVLALGVVALRSF